MSKQSKRIPITAIAFIIIIAGSLLLPLAFANQKPERYAMGLPQLMKEVGNGNVVAARSKWIRTASNPLLLRFLPLRYWPKTSGRWAIAVELKHPIDGFRTVELHNPQPGTILDALFAHFKRHGVPVEYAD